MRRGIVGAFVVMLLAGVAFAADVSGVWIGEYRTNEGGVFDMTLTLKADGTALTGTLKQGDGEAVPIEDGKVDGAHVSFAITRSFRGQSQKILYKGTIDGNEMKMSRTTGETTREFTFKKQ